MDDPAVDWEQFSTLAKAGFVFACWLVADLLTILTVVVGKLVLWLVTS